MSETEQRERTTGRTLTVSAYGKDPEALEATALDEARRFFGQEARLEVVDGYKVFLYREEPAESRYHASVAVREVI